MKFASRRSWSPSASPCSLCGYVELLFRDFWLEVTNGYAFWGFDELKATHSGVWEAEMRATGNVPVDLKDRFRFSFLNTPLLEDLGLSNILRIFGPNMSPISFGYGVGFFSLFLFSVGRPLLAMAALPLLVLCSVKGALIMTVFVWAAWISTRLLGPVSPWLLGLLALVVYAIVAIRVGLQIGDYHVIGFMGGWNGFLQNPFGRGLGRWRKSFGRLFSIDWSAAQQAGTVDGAVESAIGVFFSIKWALAALVPLGVLFRDGVERLAALRLLGKPDAGSRLLWRHRRAGQRLVSGRGSVCTAGAWAACAA